MDSVMPAADWIAYHARVAPGRLACIDLVSGREFTYAAFDRRICRLANWLRAGFAVRRGDRVLVLSKNDSDVFELQFACQRLGAVFVPLNWRLAPDELRFIAADAAAVVLFHGAEFAPQALAIRADVPLRGLVRMDNGLPGPYEAGLAAAADECASGPGRDSDVWAMIYTSGTTGRPKGAQITYRMAFVNAVTLCASFGIDGDSRNLVVLPTFHTGGLNVFANPVFFAGGVNLVLREFEPARVVTLLASGGVSHMLGVPTIHAALAAEPGFEALDPARLRGLAVAGAPCPPALIERYAVLGLDLRQCWGMTEAGPLALITPAQASGDRLASSGLPSMFAQTMIVDADARPVPAGTVGELLVRGPVVTPGYWNRPEATRDAFAPDGWFRTGDAAWRDEAGFHYIVDRWKDMFISGGENVYPAEIERVLAQAEGVEDCAVIGMADEKWGECGLAFVVPRRGRRPAAQALAAHCARHLARYKVPRQFVLVEALPRNAAGKVLKTRLRQSAAAIEIAAEETR
ncbi:MAG: AMP-binding protein [Reyranellaceae bacterium]